MYNSYYQPQTTIPKVHGRDGAMSLSMAPNSSVLAIDDSAPLVWLIISDQFGRVSAEPYDIAKHVDPPPVDAASITSRLDNLEHMIREMAENASKSKPNDRQFKPKPDTAVAVAANAANSTGNGQA